MAYTFEQSYYFRPYRGNSSFWLNRYGNGSIASHQKATLYTAAGSADQSLEVYTTNSEGVFTGWHCLHIEFSGEVLKATLDTEEEKSIVITPDTEAGIFYDPVAVLCG